MSTQAARQGGERALPNSRALRSVRAVCALTCVRRSQPSIGLAHLARAPSCRLKEEHARGVGTCGAVVQASVGHDAREDDAKNALVRTAHTPAHRRRRMRDVSAAQCGAESDRLERRGFEMPSKKREPRPRRRARSTIQFTWRVSTSQACTHQQSSAFPATIRNLGPTGNSSCLCRVGSRSIAFNIKNARGPGSVRLCPAGYLPNLGELARARTRCPFAKNTYVAPPPRCLRAGAPSYETG